MSDFFSRKSGNKREILLRKHGDGGGMRGEGGRKQYCKIKIT